LHRKNFETSSTATETAGGGYLEDAARRRETLTGMAGGGGVDAQRDRLRLAGAAQDGTATRQQEGRRRRKVSARKHAASETAPGADVYRQQHAGAAWEPAA